VKSKTQTCPHCGGNVRIYQNPLPTVDILIQRNNRILLIQRKNFPYGWALPGGFIDYGESAEKAAVREAREETKLEVYNLRLLGVYSKPDRDPRFHTISVVYTAEARGESKASDDAADLGWFDRRHLPSPLAFDHKQILTDFFDEQFH